MSELTSELTCTLVNILCTLVNILCNKNVTVIFITTLVLLGVLLCTTWCTLGLLLGEGVGECVKAIV